ncbi:MAG: hypothetical protein V1696_01995 [Candidatus Jorgensenbacteria bacterium]
MHFWKIALWLAIALAVALGLFLALAGGGARAATNISSTSSEHFAWDDVVGWWDFNTTNTVTVYSTRITGYASSSVGEMSLDCATSPGGNVCGASNYGVCNGIGPHETDGTCPYASSTTGTLTGFAWNDTVGWISFNCDNSSHAGGENKCNSSYYSVDIDSSGDFSGCAWNDTVGWVSFANTGECSSPNPFKVRTSWRATSTFGYVESATLDTGITSGATLQSIIWQGSLPTDTVVDFQIATSSDSGGPWDYYGPQGSTSAYYGLACPNEGSGAPGSTAPPGTPVCVSKTIGAARYFRYRVRLRSDRIQTVSPRVDDVILNWTR